MSKAIVLKQANAIFGDPTAVAAIMGNIDVETGGTFDYEQRQIGGGPGRGLFQMEPPMWAAYQKWLGGKPDSSENQLRYVHHELQNGHHIGAGHAKRIRETFQSGNVETATKEFCDRFERPGEPHLDRRIKSAQQFTQPDGAIPSESMKPAAPTYPAAKHFDIVTGIDIHIVLIPTPTGPVPTPIPHPFLGFLLDLMDYMPIVGSTVLINGTHRAIAGTVGVNRPPHIPIGGPFQIPPGNELEELLGSSVVCFDGEAAGYNGLTALTCQSIGSTPPARSNPKKKTKLKSLVLPSGIVQTIPNGPPVMIAGPPTVSLAALGSRAAINGLGKSFKKLKNTRTVQRALERFKKVRQRTFKDMESGFLKCKILRAEPVNSITGEVVVQQEDFSLPWRIPLTWRRNYRSNSRHRGVCGHGWETPGDARLEFQRNAAGETIHFFHDGNASATVFDHLPEEYPIIDPLEGTTLTADDTEYRVRTKSCQTYHFPKADQSNRTIRLQRISDACGNWIIFSWNGTNLHKIQESSGIWIDVQSTYSRIDAMVLHHPQDNHPTRLVRYEYLLTSELEQVFDRADQPYTFAYANNRMARHTDRNGLWFAYNYDDEGKCIRAYGPNGLYDYTFQYLLDDRKTIITDSLKHRSELAYTAQFLPYEETNAAGETTYYTYDEYGRTTAVIDGLGHRTDYKYDHFGNTIAEEDPIGASVCREFDEQSRIVKFSDPNGHTWLFEWDDRDLLRKRIAPDGAEWTYKYNNLGDLINTTDPRGHNTQYTPDTFGNIVAVVDALDRTTTIEVDTMGLVTRVREPGGRQTTYDYDQRGNLTSIGQPSENVTTFEYDSEDRLLATTDSIGRTTRFRYFGIDELAERQNPDGTTLRYEYDTEEQLLSVTNERGQTYSFQRDSLGRIMSTKDYWDAPTHYHYDQLGNLQERLDPLGNQVIYEYDPVGSVIAITRSDGSIDSFDYDPAGNCVAFQNNTIKVEREFDDRHRLVKETQGDFTVEYDYDETGNRISRKSGHGNEISYSYDALDRLESVQANSKSVLQIGYDEAGDPVHEIVTGKMRRIRSFDVNGRLLEQTLLSGPSKATLDPIAARIYKYDRVGRLTKRSDARNGINRYEYDLQDRITRWIRPNDQATDFHPDSAGDLLQPVSYLRAGWKHRVMQYEDGRYLFDRAGHLVERQRDGQCVRFRWDLENRLVSAVAEDSKCETRMAYDPLGRRVSKIAQDSKSHFYWDGDAILSDVDGGHIREFIFWPGSFEPIAWVNEMGELYSFDTDQIDLPHEVVNESGQVVWSATFGAFGETLETSQAVERNPIRFQGQYYDGETGLCYNRHRNYDSHTAAFVSQDPIGLVGGINIYEYVPNAWKYIDPLGLAATQKCGPSRSRKKWTRINPKARTAGDRKSKYGSYTITFHDGQKYHGMGNLQRAYASGREKYYKHGLKPVDVEWKAAEPLDTFTNPKDPRHKQKLDEAYRWLNDPNATLNAIAPPGAPDLLEWFG